MLLFISLLSLSERAIAESLIVRDFDQFGQNFDFLLANDSAIALSIRVLEFRNDNGFPSLTEESYSLGGGYFEVLIGDF